MEADWARTYPGIAGGDFRRALFGPEPLGARRLRALIDGLPPDSMIWRRVPGWGSAEELLALNAEVAHSIVRVLVAAFSKKGAQLPKALKVPRPSDRSRAPAPSAQRLTPNTLADFRIGIARRAPAAAPNGGGD